VILPKTWNTFSTFWIY